jgi:hypothetical protein
LALAFYTARLLQITINTQAKESQELDRQRELLEIKEKKIEQHLLDEYAAKFGDRWVDTSMFHVRKVCREIVESRLKPQEVMDTIKK